jgi:hypothetical protein
MGAIRPSRAAFHRLGLGLGVLANPPGANPLGGANLFVDGPAHGNAAGPIVHLLGLAQELLGLVLLRSVGPGAEQASLRQQARSQRQAPA